MTVYSDIYAKAAWELIEFGVEHDVHENGRLHLVEISPVLLQNVGQVQTSEALAQDWERVQAEGLVLNGSMTQVVFVTSVERETPECRHCQRPLEMREHGWASPDADNSDDNEYGCEDHDTFEADHEPTLTSVMRVISAGCGPAAAAKWDA